MCPRTDNGGPQNPHLTGQHLSLETIQKSFPPEFIQKLEAVHFCGNFGDPVAAKDSLEIVAHFRAHSPGIRIMFNTNGGARAPQWWARLGEQMNVPGSVVVFGIDGLEFTNHIYRRNVKWDKLMANVRAFIAAGGRARWEFLIFKHNQHQCEEARQLSQELGFVEFQLKKTARFFDHVEQKIISFPVLNEKREIESYLEPPVEVEMQNSTSVQLAATAPVPQVQSSRIKILAWRAKRYAKARFREAVSALASGKELAEDLNCIHTNEKSVYISARGEVLPCCFWGGQIRYSDPGLDGKKIGKMAKESVGGFAKTSIYEKSLRDLMAGRWFRAIDKSLRAPRDSKFRVGTCGRLCTRQAEIVKNEFS